MFRKLLSFEVCDSMVSGKAAPVTLGLRRKAWLAIEQHAARLPLGSSIGIWPAKVGLERRPREVIEYRKIETAEIDDR